MYFETKEPQIYNTVNKQVEVILKQLFGFSLCYIIMFLLLSNIMKNHSTNIFSLIFKISSTIILICFMISIMSNIFIQN
jgi:hypothetical protein